MVHGVVYPPPPTTPPKGSLTYFYWGGGVASLTPTPPPCALHPTPQPTPPQQKHNPASGSVVRELCLHARNQCIEPSCSHYSP